LTDEQLRAILPEYERQCGLPEDHTDIAGFLAITST
jgi:hypothetical protein